MLFTRDRTSTTVPLFKLHGMVMICMPAVAGKDGVIKGKIVSAARKADIVEVWMDSIPASVSAAQIRKMTGKPLLAVCKGKREHGRWRGGERKRIERLIECAEAGFDYVDIDLRTDARLVAELATRVHARGKGSNTLGTGSRTCGSGARGEGESVHARGSKNAAVKLIVSYHDFAKAPPPKKLAQIYGAAVGGGADLVKISVLAKNVAEVAGLLMFAAKITANKKNKPLVLTTMGEKGKIGRIAAPLFGSAIVYVASDSKNKTAPGQLTAEEYKKVAGVLDSR